MKAHRLFVFLIASYGTFTWGGVPQATAINRCSISPVGCITIPTVEITSLYHYVDLTHGDLSDGVYFPCGSGKGTCSSTGFSAAITNGDDIKMTFAAPPGMRFHVFYDSSLFLSNEIFQVLATWQAPGSDAVTVTSPGVVNFANLTGTAPTETLNTLNQFGVGDAGELVEGYWSAVVTGDFTFTAVTFNFSVINSPPGTTALFGPVNQYHFFTSGSGPQGTPDQILMQLEPLPDTDYDGVPDLTDNCPFTPNGPLLGTCLNQTQEICKTNSDCVSGICSLNQEDSGGVGSGSPPDGIGDACQCGDVDNNGIVNNNDASLIKRAVAQLDPYPGGVTELPGYNKCQVVNGGSGRTCNNVQATIIERAVAGLAPGIVQGCHAATIFP